MHLEKKNILLYKIILFILVFINSAFPQIEVTNNITIDDGLAYSEVTCAYKDSRGIMWFGTSSGLSEWNSVSFKNYYGSDGLPSRFIKSICEDENKTLYIATTAGLVYKKGENFIFPEKLPAELKSQINDIYLSNENKLYVLTEHFGVWVKEHNIFHKVKSEVKNSKIIPISILERKNGEILIGTRSNGIYRIKNNSLYQIIFNNIYNKYPVIDLVEFNENTLYIALQGFGLIINKNATSTIKNILTSKEGLPSNQINDLELTADKELYVATMDGIAIIRNNKVIKRISKENGLINEFILKIYPLNKDTFLLLSAGNGFFYFRDNYFLSFNKNSGLLHDNVWRINELKDGAYCFLTDEGISLLKGKTFSSITKKNGLGDNLVVSCYIAENGDIYLSTYSDGVNLIKDNRIIRINENFGMFENTTCTIKQYRKNILWFVTRSKGIAVFNGKRIIDTLGIKEGLPNLNILTSFKKKDGTILVSLEKNGIYKYQKGRFVPYSEKINNCSIWAIYEDKVGNLYFGTNDKGLIKYSVKGLYDTVTTEKGLSNNCVVSIIDDKNGNIYAGTDKGLNIIKFLSNGRYSIRKLYKQSGLANSECNQGAIYRDNSGNIWIGTIGGTTKINPAKIENPDIPIPIVFTSVNILNRKYLNVDSLDNMILDYDENDISFEFAGLNYSDPMIVKYFYKLDKADNNWILDKRNTVRYANLSPGKYRFMVAASNAWGTWSKPIEINFEIKTPYWQTWWFFTVIFLFSISIIYSIFNYRVKNIMRLEKLRSKISSDLHDEIGSGLSEISILSELLKLNKSLDKKLIDGLEQIGNSTRELIKSLSDIIWIVNPREERLQDLIFRIKNTYQEVFYQAKINLNISQSDITGNIKLPLELRQNIYLIIKEAVNNSLKYSKCKNIFINIRKINQKIIFEIIDDGAGFNIGNIEKGNGLFNMKKRAEIIKSEFLIESSSDGTKIKLIVKLKGNKKRWLK